MSRKQQPTNLHPKVQEAARAGTLAMLQHVCNDISDEDFEATYGAIYSIIAGTLLLLETPSMRVADASAN